jgi:zinc protease
MPFRTSAIENPAIARRRASLLARFELLGGYAEKDRYLQRIRAVTAADIQRVARTYFLPHRKNVGVLLPRP